MSLQTLLTFTIIHARIVGFNLPRALQIIPMLTRTTVVQMVSAIADRHILVFQM